MKLFLQMTTILFLALSFTLTASALDLAEARKKNLVTETPDGFIKANSAGDRDASVAAVVKSVNSKRLSAYKALAKKNSLGGKKVTADEVGKISHSKIMKKLRGK